MRSIEPELTEELNRHVGNVNVAKAPTYSVKMYRQLVEQVAFLAHLNKDHLLFFRGQGADFQNKAGASTFYPSIYRGEYLTHDEIRYRFRVLEESGSQLRDLFNTQGLQGSEDVTRKSYVRWSILQHYGVCSTPLLDFTHSLRVACSFAQILAQDTSTFVYVFGLPYISNRITINSEHDLVIVRLLSISPPQALRPYFQEGYLAGTTDIRWEYIDKTELDFNRRLLAKFAIPKSARFWGSGFQMIPDNVLFPRDDRVDILCKSIIPTVREELHSDNLGDFVRLWSSLEDRLITHARLWNPKVQSLRQAIDELIRAKQIDEDLASSLDSMRLFRNRAVHSPERVQPKAIDKAIMEIQQLLDQMEY